MNNTKQKTYHFRDRIFALVPEAGRAFALQIRPAWRPQGFALRYPSAHLFAKNSPPDCFLNAADLLRFKSYNQ